MPKRAAESIVIWFLLYFIPPKLNELPVVVKTRNRPGEFPVYQVVVLTFVVLGLNFGHNYCF